LDPLDKEVYDELAGLYTGMRRFEELVYIAEMRLEQAPDDRNAPLWLASGLLQLNKRDEAREKLEKFIAELATLPEKHAEYVQACLQMSQIMAADDSRDAQVRALEWLNKAAKYAKAADYASDSVKALANRTRFYREAATSLTEIVQKQLLAPARADLEAANISAGTAREKLVALARKDLEAADELATDSPTIRYFLGTEWLAHGELDRAGAELQAVEGLSQERIEEDFFDTNDWVVFRFLFASELATRRGTPAEACSLADEALETLTQEGHRMRVLPAAIPLYVAAGKVLDARDYLNEYVDAMLARKGTAESDLQIAYLQALVARAEEKPYVVIDTLQPVVAANAGGPALWGLLAEAYIRTDQSGRAVGVLAQYLRFRPQDPEMAFQLARQYSRLGKWNEALESAQTAESLNPTDVAVKLLRIGVSINQAIQDAEGGDTAAIETMSAELAALRQGHPDRVDIRTLQAIIADYHGQPEEAEKELKLAIEECDDSLKAELQLAGHYRRTDQMAEAVALCEGACERHAQVAEPWLSLSELHVAEADYEAARDCLKQGLDAVIDEQGKHSLSIKRALLELIHGDRTAGTGIQLLKELAAQDEREIKARLLLLGTREVREDLAAAQKLVDELKQAEGESGVWWRLHEASLWLSSDEWRSKQRDIADRLQYCIDADPQWSAPVLLLAGMYERLGDFSRVEEICRQALAWNPSATDIANRLLSLLERQERFAEAERILEQIETSPRVASAWQVRMALQTGDVSRAVDELKLRVFNDDQDASSRIQLGRLIYQQTGDAEQAFTHLKKAEDIAPASRTLAAVKASIYRSEGQTQESRRVLDEYVADHNDFNAYWMRAVYLAEDGEIELAEKDYQRLTTLTENGAPGYVLLGNFYAGTERLDEGVATLEEGVLAYPEDLGLKRNLMKLLFVRDREGDRERAIAVLGALEGRLPQDPELMTIQAFQLLREPTPQARRTAKTNLESAVKLEPRMVDAHLALIGMAMEEREYETARDYAIAALAGNPKNSALLSARGRAEVALDNTQMAAQLADFVLENDPNSAEALAVLADAALVSESDSLSDRAQTLIESAVDRNPTSEPLLLLRARFLVALEEPETAIPELEAYCQTPQGGSSVTVLVTLADLYRLSGDMDRSKEKIEQAERLAPDSQTVVHARFLWLMAQNRFGELAGISSAYLSAKGQNPAIVLTAASMLGAADSMELKKEAAITLYQTGDAERAKGIYRELRQQYPGNVRVLNDLAWILQEHDKDDEVALELANRGLRLEPENLHLLDTRGVILSKMTGRFADAKTDFEDLVRLSAPDSQRRAKALLQLGRICVKLGNLEEAREHLEKALEIDRAVNAFTAEERSEIASIVQQSGV